MAGPPKPALEPLLGRDGCARLQRALTVRALHWALAVSRFSGRAGQNHIGTVRPKFCKPVIMSSDTSQALFPAPPPMGNDGKAPFGLSLTYILHATPHWW